MIPTRHDYYRRRAREHRRLAQAADAPDQRAMHDTLGNSYAALARDARRREVVTLKR